MSKAIQCDNCDATIAADNAEARTWWLKVAWYDGPVRDLCSINCAREHLEALIDQAAEIREVDVHRFFEDEDGVCPTCGEDRDAPWHVAEGADVDAVKGALA